jgi:two-component system chemotaxis response regulator CheB
MTVRCLVVDDSPTMRAILTALLSRDEDIEVVGTAGDAHRAREMIRELNPDVITLDVEMPHMDGLDFLERLMRLRPMPVVMCSTLTERGAEASIRALELGAVDCIAKPKNGIRDLLATDDGQFAAIVKAAASTQRRIRHHVKPAVPTEFRGNGNIIAIGASTGGVEALYTLLTNFPADCPPTVIVQHMPTAFTRSFAARLDGKCRPTIAEAREGAPLEPGHVYIAPGGTHHLMVRGRERFHCHLVAADPVKGHRPSVDVLFRSVSQTIGPRAVGVILTGMGADGAAGLLAMREAGARTLGQSAETCVVYGMPRAAHESGACEQMLPVDKIAGKVLDLCSR